MDAEVIIFEVYLLIKTSMKRSEGTLAQMILMTAAMGTANTMPGMPHSQPQAMREKMTTRGLNPSPSP